MLHIASLKCKPKEARKVDSGAAKISRTLEFQQPPIDYFHFEYF